MKDLLYFRITAGHFVKLAGLVLLTAMISLAFYRWLAFQGEQADRKRVERVRVFFREITESAGGTVGVAPPGAPFSRMKLNPTVREVMALGGPPDKKDGNFWTWRMKSEVEPMSGPLVYRPAVTVEVQDEVITGYTFDGNDWVRSTWHTQRW